MDTALQLLDLFNKTAPGVAELILMVRRKDGSISIVATLDEAADQFHENIQKAQEWLRTHPGTSKS